MKKLALLVVLVLTASLSVADDTANWQGYTWNSFGYGDLAVSGTGLQITTTQSYGFAYTTLDSTFQSYSTPWLSATFLDDASSATGAYLGFENPTGTNPAWGEIGYDPSVSANTYGVYTYNEVTGQYELIALGQQRTTGEHLVQVGRLADGTVDFYLDGQLAYTAQLINPGSFSDVYLFSNGGAGSVTFTSFEAGDGYARGPNGTFDPIAVPEPASLLLLGSGLMAVAGAVRRRLR